MAQLRELKTRIKSVRNTIKITRTMELVATARAKQNQDRLTGAQPYFETLDRIARDVSGAGAAAASGEGAEPAHPFLKVPETEKRVALLVITANRGFCGGYNSNVLALAFRKADAERAKGRTVDLYVSGKKGNTACRFQKIPMAESWHHIGDQPKFAEVAEIAETLSQKFVAGEIDRLDVAYWRYLSASNQAPVVETVLPIRPDDAADGDDAKVATDLIIEPSAEAIFESVIPLRYRTNVFRAFLEAAASEQLARRAAMKAATDNGSEMGRVLNQRYNRARQAQITTEILEVMGGAEALK